MSQATLVVDLGFGDAGKGTIVDYLCQSKNVSAVVRFNGGHQAAHNVVTKDGRQHTFSQFGSGTLVPGVRTYLSHWIVIDPLAILNEDDHLRSIGCVDALARLTVDAEAKVATRFHKIGNRIRESRRGEAGHGSCGVGVGETMADSITHPEATVLAGDLRSPATLLRKLTLLRDIKFAEFGDEMGELARPDAPFEVADQLWRAGMRLTIVDRSYLRRLADQGDLVFEGSQGVLLDEWYGFHPYTTWSTATFTNALALLNEIGFSGPVQKLGLLRAYFTRHGPGPFPTESRELTRQLPDIQNVTNQWQRHFRVGWFDAVLARYAIAACGGVDGLAITNLDRWMAVPDKRFCTAYEVPSALVADPHVARLFNLPLKTELTDLDYQQSLTDLLELSVPILRSVPEPFSLQAYLSLIEHELDGAPVLITSHGPTAADKQLRTVAARSVA